MSIQAITEVFQLRLPPRCKFVLLCIADACDQFFVSFPSIRYLSEMTCIPERTLQRIVSWLIDKKYIIVYWDFLKADKLRQKKIRHFRLNISGKPMVIRPDYSNCPVAIRSEVIRRFERTCVYCGNSGDEKNGPDGKPWEIDRIVPGSSGGSYEASNITLSCKECNMKKGAKMAPQNTFSLGDLIALDGATSDKKGCHSEQNVVPPAAHYPSEEPSEEPSITENRFEMLDEERTPPKKEPSSGEVFNLASRVFRQATKLRFGTLGEKHEGRWKGLLEEYGQEVVLGAIGLWAREFDKDWMRKQTTKMNWIAVFLKKADDYIQDFKDYQAPEPGDDRRPEVDDDEVTIDDIRRERGQDRRGKKG